MSTEKKVVVIGGGTGIYTVLSALKKYNLNLSAIVSMCDDGGSTGRLRDEYGVLPPGDIRRSLIALSSADLHLRKLFDFRFKSGGLVGHNFGNLFLTALQKNSGSFSEAVKMAEKILRVKGRVIPVTLDNIRLYAELENGEIVNGETNIDIPKHNPDLKIKRIFVKPSAKANPEAIRAILQADAVIIGPGDLYTSILPNFLTEGLTNALKKTKAKNIYVCNLMTKRGETDNYSAKDFIEKVEEYILPAKLNHILVNSQLFSPVRLKKYQKEKAETVKVPIEYTARGRLKKINLATDTGLIRHDHKKLGRAIIKWMGK